MDAEHAELGYWIGKPYWGAGFATEACAAVVAHAFDAMASPIFGPGISQDNPASQRVLDKLGFSPEGEEMRDCAARGEPVPLPDVPARPATGGGRAAAPLGLSSMRWTQVPQTTLSWLMRARRRSRC